MALFRKKPEKPEVFEAYQWFKNGDHPGDGPADKEGVIVRRFRRPDVPGDQPCGVCAKPLCDHGWIDAQQEGGFTVHPGDWIITDTKGGHYPCNAETFEALYEPVKG